MKQALHTCLTVFVAAAVAYLVATGPGRAAFNPTVDDWDAAFELDPTDTDNVSQGAGHMRQIKSEVSDRLETEHDFGTFDNVTDDTGRHLAGSARVFVQNAEPTVDGTISANCLAEADDDGNRGCDAGRIWVDLDGPDDTDGNADDFTISVCEDDDADGDCDDWEVIVNPSSIIPTNGIILWDASDTCPTGFSEATDFRLRGIRGADIADANGVIPNSAGVNCGPNTAGSGCGSPSARHDDFLDTAELPAHTHTVTGNTDNATQGPRVRGTNNNALEAGTAQNTGSAGGALAHTHPFRSVLFCKKD